MPILNINVSSTGQVDVNPRRVTMVTTDSLATVTTAGYVNSGNTQGFPILPTDVFEIIYAYNVATESGTLGFFQPTFSNGIITLDIWDNAGGNVLLPVTSGDFAVFNGTTGQIKDAGYLPSNAAKTTVAMLSSPVTQNHIAVYVDNNGTIFQDVATAVNGGNIQAGYTGKAGSLISYSSTPTTGYLAIQAVANTGSWATVISNASMGQACVLTIPDPVGPAAKFALAPGTLVSGNLLSASGTTGLIQNAGFTFIRGTTASATISGTSNAFTIAGLTAGCFGSCVIRTSQNAASIVSAVPSTNTLTVTFSTAPGTTTTVDYLYITG